MQTKPGKLFIFSAPSGSGKTTIVKYLLENIEGLTFSISATSRKMRSGEQNGKDYFFMSEDEFKSRIAKNEFLEWEEVYSGSFYGTLKSEVDEMLQQGKHVLFDVDVLGGLNIKQHYQDQALAVFVKAPSISVLQERLQSRLTDSAEQIQKRIEKAEFEMTFADKFDIILINDDLAKARNEIISIVLNFINT
jgi:guanylate kinase